jgi:hypothetical protein
MLIDTPRVPVFSVGICILRMFVLTQVDDLGANDNALHSVADEQHSEPNELPTLHAGAPPSWQQHVHVSC